MAGIDTAPALKNMKSTDIFSQASVAAKDGDFELASSLLIPLAESGDAEAQYRLGMLRSDGANMSAEVAYGWLEKAANQNHPDALFRWASYCRPRESALIVKAAELGSTAAQYSLGVSYATGSDGYPKDEGEAIKWYERAAKVGDDAAQYNLATMLLYGEGTAKDPVQARRWIMKSARQGNELAKKFLPELLRDI